MMGIGFPELMIILVIIMIIFGAGKLPEIGSAFGNSIRNFKKSMKDAEKENEELPEGSTEFRFVDENPKTAWSTVNVSQHPKHYTSNFEDEKVDVSRFFNEEQFYHDNTSPQSKTHIPDRCIKNTLNEVVCEFNNKLQLIPPRLIEDPNNNLVLNSIGNKDEDIYQSVNSFDISEVNGNSHQVWNYKDEKYINGGVYFNNVVGSSPKNESFLRIDSIKKDYSF